MLPDITKSIRFPRLELVDRCRSLPDSVRRQGGTWRLRPESQSDNFLHLHLHLHYASSAVAFSLTMLSILPLNGRAASGYSPFRTISLSVSSGRRRS